jgi:outer membrane protein
MKVRTIPNMARPFLKWPETPPADGYAGRDDPTKSTGARPMTFRATTFIHCGLALVALVAPLAGQEPAQVQVATLTLDEAIDLARRNNPLYRQTVNDESVADWQARQAYANFLPNVSASNNFNYTASGVQRFGNLSAAELGGGRTPVYYSSSYGLNVNMQLSGATFFGLAQARANARAVEARGDAAAYTLQTTVTQVYLSALRAHDQVAIARSALESADESRKLAEARSAVGAATRLDLATAQVTYGRAEVALLQAENLYQTERLRLLQTIGIQLEQEVELTSEFPVFEPEWDVQTLTDAALRAHPQVIAARKAEDAAGAASRSAWSTYLPSLNLFGGWSGFVRKAADTEFLINQARGSAQSAIRSCERTNLISAGLSTPLPGTPVDCETEFAFTSADEAAILAENRRYPFDYTPNPSSFTIQVSVPIFDGFTRETQLQTARVAADDARHQRRAEELQRRTDVATALLNLKAAYQTVQIEERNAAAAEEQLTIAQERYRLAAGCGAAGQPGTATGGLCTTFLELTQAQQSKVQADQAHLAARYTFHEQLAALEAAVGRSLR